MGTSQNGWPVHTNQSRLVSVPKIRGRVAPEVAPIFADLVQQIDQSVEDVDAGADDWGYAYRPIRGKSSGYSNHSSGTAVDVNADKHPLGKRKTWSKSQNAALDKILARYVDPQTGKNVVRAGKDYRIRKDDMHFEIVANKAAVARVVQSLRGAKPVEVKPASSALPTLQAYPLKQRTISYAALIQSIKQGVRTESMQSFQACLTDPIPLDGLWGGKTLAAFRADLKRRGWRTDVTVPSRDHVYWLTRGKIRRLV